MANFSIQSLGADPELFFVHKATNTPIASIGLLGGTKADPRPIPNLPEGFSVQEDNVAAEFNIPPCRRLIDFSTGIAKMVSYIEKEAKKRGLSVVAKAALEFGEMELDKPGAREMGCDPDFNAWTGEKNPRPSAPYSLRTAAGHVHVGFLDHLSDYEKMVWARMFDLFLTVPSILVTEHTARRTLYGKAGAMRFKEYGLEQRTLDNFWVVEKGYRAHVWETCHLISDKLNKDFNFWESALYEFQDPIIDTINNHNIETAVRLSNNFDVPSWE